MALQTSGSISFSEIAAEFGGTAPHSISEYYRGGDNVDDSKASVTYTEVKGNNGSPAVGTQTPNASSFSYAWHNRTFSGSTTNWGTSMVRETDNQVAHCKTGTVYKHRLGWRWTSGISGYTQNPYYFKIKVVGKHRTSETGSYLTGTHYYTGSITRSNDSQGEAEFTRRDAEPPAPSATSINNGTTGEAESGIYYLWDLTNCTVEFYFNANEPNTSSASFAFYWDANDDASTGNNQQGILANQDVPETGAVSLTDYYGAEDI
jgi:hypothetical protein